MSVGEVSRFWTIPTGCEADKPLNATEAQPLQETRPNILLVVVDDVGFSDLGFFGSEIPTPTLDSLATSGITFTNFHVAPTCSPRDQCCYRVSIAIRRAWVICLRS